MTLQELLNELETTFAKTHDRYYKAHEKFDTFRGLRPDQYDRKKLKKAIDLIQDTYVTLYPIFTFIERHHTSALAAVRGYPIWVQEATGQVLDIEGAMRGIAAKNDIASKAHKEKKRTAKK